MKPRGDTCNQKGIALLLVLWVLAFLSVIAAEFSRSMRTELMIARNFKETSQGYYAALGGIHLTVYQMLRTMFNPRPASEVAKEEGADIDWRVNTEIPAIPFGEGQIMVRIDNEGGKVNINLADQALILLLLKGLPISEDEKSAIVDSIMDWRDSDDLHRMHGAEEDYYQSLPNPYHCKNGDFDSVEELLLVKGITPGIFHECFRQTVTVYPSRKAVETKTGAAPGAAVAKTGFNYNKFNINAAPPALLLLLPGFTPEIVAAVHTYRREKDIASNGDYLTLVGAEAYAATQNYITFSLSPYFRVTSRGLFAEGKVRQEISAMIYLDLKSKEKYRIVQWFDHMPVAR
ncbi:MAG: general secretion pathway protein GspK [Thermodesulfobacteriota bacterium]